MVKRDGAETRRERIGKIARDLQAAFHQKKENGEKEEVELLEFVGFEMYDTGLTKEKTIEYLKVIEMRGQCVLDFENDKIRKPQV